MNFSSVNLRSYPFLNILFLRTIRTNCPFLNLGEGIPAFLTIFEYKCDQILDSFFFYICAGDKFGNAE